MSQRVQYQPVGAGQLVGQALEAYRRLFRQLMAVACILVLPAVAIVATGGVLFVEWLRHHHLLWVTQHPTIRLHVSQSAVSWLLLSSVGVALVVLLSLTLMSGVISIIVSQGYIGAAPSWRAAIRVGLGRLGALLFAFVLVEALVGLVNLVSYGGASLAQAAGSPVVSIVASLVNLACLAAEIYLYVSFVIVSAIVVLEGEGGVKALRRCVELMRGRWWGTLGTVVLVALVQVLGAIGIAVIVDLALSWTNAVVATVFAFAVAAFLVFPLQGVAGTFIYFDLRNRRGGLDVGELATRIHTEPGPGSTTPAAVPYSPSAPQKPSTPPVGWDGWPSQPGSPPDAPGWPVSEDPGRPPGGAAEDVPRRSDPGPDPGASSPQGGTGPAGTDPAGPRRPNWPTISPKPMPRRARPAPPPEELDSGA